MPTAKINITKIKALKEGDIITRVLGTLPMKLVVSKVTEDIITVEALDGNKWAETATKYFGKPMPPPFWEFNRNTGMEIDEDLKWDGVNTTGSYLDPDYEAKNN